jgi:V/A-type H+/Na+-transporting ATPase subunit C
MAQEKYLFAIGAIREAEKRLVSENDMERMMDAPGAEQAFKVFNDLSYSDELLDINQPDRYADVLRHDLKQVKEFISAIAEDEDLRKLLFAEDDFYNLKLIFKAALINKDIKGRLSPVGYLDAEKLFLCAAENNGTVNLGKDYEDIIKRAKEKISAKIRPGEIDSYFEKELFDFMLVLARRINDNDLNAIVETRIDGANIKIIFRGHQLGYERHDIAGALIGGGALDTGDMALFAELEEADMIDRINNKISDGRTVAELRELSQDFELWRLEKILDNRLLRILKEVKMKPIGAAAIYAYYLGKKNEIKNIGMIMAGKLNGIKSKEIKERVRILY